MAKLRLLAEKKGRQTGRVDAWCAGARVETVLWKQMLRFAQQTMADWEKIRQLISDAQMSADKDELVPGIWSMYMQL